MPSTYNQIARNEFPSTDRDRIGKFDVAYAFMDERMHTITVIVPQESDTPEEVERLLREKIARAEASGPKSITIE
jgi:hypothetical protein